MHIYVYIYMYMHTHIHECNNNEFGREQRNIRAVWEKAEERGNDVIRLYII